MFFTRVLFGFSPKEVSLHVSALEKQVEQKNVIIRDLQHSLQNLELRNGELELRLEISKRFQDQTEKGYSDR